MRGFLLSSGICSAMLKILERFAEMAGLRSALIRGTIGAGAFIPASNEQVAMLAWIFGDCREGQISAALQRYKFDTPCKQRVFD